MPTLRLVPKREEPEAPLFKAHCMDRWPAEHRGCWRCCLCARMAAALHEDSMPACNAPWSPPETTVPLHAQESE